MRISVVIPVHDRRALVGRAIRSVLSQTLPPVDVVVVDDGSSDGVAAWLPNAFPSVTVLRLDENRGVSHARNRGVERARGDWIAFLDSDDEWLPDKLERQAGALRGAAPSPLCHTDEIWIRRGVRVNPCRHHAKRGGDIFLDCLPRCVVSPSAALVDRAVLALLGGFDESLPACEDYDLWLRMAARWPLCYVDAPLVIKHGGHEDQLSRRYPAMDRFRVAALEKLLGDDALPSERRRAVLETLLGKLKILAAGARKRGRHAQADEWQAQFSRSRAALDAMDAAA